MKNWMDKENIKEFLVKTLILVGILALVGAMIICVIRYDSISAGFDKFIKILSPFIYGMIIAYLLNPLNNKIEKALRKFRDKRHRSDKGVTFISITITEILFVFILIAVGALIIPQVAVSIRDIMSAMPTALDNLEEFVNTTVAKHEWVRNVVGDDFGELQDKVTTYISNSIKPNMESIATNIALSATSMVKGVFNFIIGIIVSIFLLANRKQFAYNSKILMYAVCGKRTSESILSETRVADKMFSGFFVGKLLDSIIIGIICFICLAIMKMPYAVLVSVIVGITNIVPFFGPFIGAVPSAIIILSADPIKAGIFLIFIAVLQQFDGNILGPKLIGNSTGLNTFWVLFSILVFGGIWGIVGMVIGVPLMAVIHDIINKTTHKLLVKRGLSEEDISKGDNG